METNDNIFSVKLNYRLTMEKDDVSIVVECEASN